MNYLRLGLFLLYLSVGLYFINSSLDFYPISDVVEDFSDLIILVGGILILFHGLIWLKPRRKLMIR